MNKERILKVVLREMTAYGKGYRCDWFGFDGRMLRDQLNEIEYWAQCMLNDEDPTEIKEETDFISEWHINDDGELIAGTEFYKGKCT